ncbi:MAG: hypothetical protein R3C61_06485 [Bacteroidia bacterium]
MRYFIPFLVVVFLFLHQGCDRKTQEKSQSENAADMSPDLVAARQNTSEKTEDPSLTPAVSDPAQKENKTSKLIEVKQQDSGLEFAMNLPEGYSVSSMTDKSGRLIYANNGEFQLEVKESGESIEQLRAYWQEGPGDMTFSRWVINGENGLLVEMEKDGQAVYHIDYLYTDMGTYRFTTPLEQSFSQYQATQMFHVCRLIPVSNKKGK